MSTIKAQPNLTIASIILILMLVAAILLPFGYGLDLGPGPNKIRAIVWEYLNAPWFSGVRLVRMGQVLEAFMYTLPAYFFIFQIFNLYRTGSRQRFLIPIGILGAVFPGLVSIFQIIGWLQGWTQPPPPVSDHRFPIYIPIPTVLILSVVLVRIFPVGSTNEPEAS